MISIVGFRVERERMALLFVLNNLRKVEIRLSHL